ncbi:MAG: TPM domain-containing protein [Acidobacteria bacterium]|nr:TPM domain-containing protein [Acidobacteriota bacterium]
MPMERSGPGRSHLCTFLLFTLLAVLSVVSLVAAVAVPPLTGRIVDTVGVVDAGTRQRLEQFLAGFEKQTSNQIAVLLIPTLEDEPEEDFAIRAAREWGLGTKENSNGVLILVVTQDRKIRIEVGRGLEGALPDGLCGRIIRDEMAPLLKRGSEKWGSAVEAGVMAVAKATKGEYVGSAKSKKKGSPWAVIVIAGLIGLGILGALTKLWVSGTVGGLAGGAATAFLAGNPLLAILGVAGGLGAGLMIPWLFRSAREHGGAGGWGSSDGHHGSSWGGGGSWGSSGGSSWSDGGFSGGGGSFDGGGASGDF